MKKFLNILLGLLFAVTAALVGWAVVSGGNEVAISWNLLWGYALLVTAVVSVILAALKGTITNPAGLKQYRRSVPRWNHGDAALSPR